MWTVCQYEHVKHLINSNWLDYNLLKRNEIKKIINVEVSYQKIDISSVVADFFEDILFEILINTVSELNNRMNEIIEIQTRGKVDLREIFTSNIYLKLEDDKCILINTLGSFDTVTKLINFE